MFKRTQLASALILALGSPFLYAQETPAQDAESEQVEVIEVSGIRGSLNKALNIKRQNLQVVDAIVAQDIGKFPDNNVVEALQRVTGIQVTDRGAGEVNTVTIRGLTDVTTTVNGRNMFTSNGRAVALADIPAALLESVEVFKTRSASQIGSGIAGQIDIKTQRPFNFEDSKVVFAARGIYQEQADKTDPIVSLLLSDRWDTSQGEFGALVNFSFARTNYRDQSITPGAVIPFVGTDPSAQYRYIDENGAVQFADYTPLQRIFPGECEPSCWTTGLDLGLPFASGSTLDLNGTDEEYLLSRDAIFGSDFTGKRERPAVNVSLQWAPNADSTYTFEAFYNGYRNESFNSLFFTFVDWWGDAGSLNDPVLFEGTNIIKERQVNAPYGFNSGDLTKSSTDTYMLALSGEWYLTDNLHVKSDLYYQDSEFETEFFAMRTERVAYGLDVDFNAGNGIPALSFWDNPDTDIDESDLTDPALWNVAQLYDSGGRGAGDALTLTVDADYTLDSGFFEKVNFGIFADKRGAEDHQRVSQDGFLGVPLSDLDPGLVYLTEDFFDGKADFPSSWAVANGHYIYANQDEFREMYGLTKKGFQQTFQIDETTLAAYVEGNFSTEIGGRLLDGQMGLRYEHVSTDMTFWDLNTNPIEQTSASASEGTLLPSLVARYHITDDLVARFAYTETIRRPNFTDLNSVIQYYEDVTDVGYGTAAGGNSNLAPVESQNLDLSLEYYFGEGNSIYATWFRRDIEGLVYASRIAIDYEGSDDIEAGTYILSAPGNTSNGVLDGWEFGAVYFPEELPAVLDGFGIQASLTLLDSNQDIPQFNNTGEITGYIPQPIFGVSDTSYSGVLIYEKENYSARLAYVWRDDFLNNYEAALFANPLGVYRKPEQSLDFQMSYDVTENLTVTFDATNLTEEYYQSYYQYPDVYNFGNALYSRTFALGVRYSM